MLNWNPDIGKINLLLNKSIIRSIMQNPWCIWSHYPFSSVFNYSFSKIYSKLLYYSIILLRGIIPLSREVFQYFWATASKWTSYLPPFFFLLFFILMAKVTFCCLFICKSNSTFGDFHFISMPADFEDIPFLADQSTLSWLAPNILFEEVIHSHFCSPSWKVSPCLR